jgi:hypothetical protein
MTNPLLTSAERNKIEVSIDSEMQARVGPPEDLALEMPWKWLPGE